MSFDLSSSSSSNIQTTTSLLLGSPFQQQTKRKITKMTSIESDSYISFIDQTSTPSASSSASSSSCSSSSDSNVHENVCFCGQSIPLEEEEEGGIYCSSECARQDAMAALTGGGLPPSTPPMKTTKKVFSDNETDDKSEFQQTFESNLIKKHLESSLALQKNTMTNLSHYRRMGALELIKDDYPIETIEEAFLTPSSTVTSTGEESSYNSCQQFYQEEMIAGQITSQIQPSFALQRWMKENEIDPKEYVLSSNLLEEKNEITRQSSEIDILNNNNNKFQDDPIIPQQNHIISLPSTPSLDSSDDEEIKIQRKRQEEIEKEIRELDKELKEKLEDFDKGQNAVKSWRKSTRSSFLFDSEINLLEDEIMLEFNSPKLDFEAPLGWRRNTKIFSGNFLGLQIDSQQTSPIQSSSPNESDLATDENHSPSSTFSRSSRIQRLQSALGMSILTEEVNENEEEDKSPVEKQKDRLSSHNQENLRIPSALDMAKDLAIIQATWNVRQHARELSNNSIGEMPSKQQQQQKNKKSSSQTLNFKTISQKRSLTNFFQRRPSHQEISSSSSSSEKQQESLSPNTFTTPVSRLTKSASPRFAMLNPWSA